MRYNNPTNYVLSLLLLPFILPFTFARHYQQVRNPNGKLLSIMKSYMNASIDPCEDFYHYSCGNWQILHSDIGKYVDVISGLDYVVNLRLRSVLRSRKFIMKAQHNVIYSKVLNYLKTCEQHTSFDIYKYLEMLKPMPGMEWPSFKEITKPPEEWNVWLTLGRLQAVGLMDFPLTLRLKHQNASSVYLEVDKLENLGYSSQEQLLCDKLESVSREGFSLVEDMQAFMQKLAVLHRTHGAFEREKISIMQLQQKVPSIDFYSLFSPLLNVKQMSAERLVVANIEYLQQLGELVASTSSSTLLHLIYIKFMGHLEKQMPRPQLTLHCMQHLRDLVPLALDYIYEQEIYQYERNTSDAVIWNVFSTMQQKFLAIIEEHSEEFSVEELQFLQQKIMQMNLNIGNLPLNVGNRFYLKYFESWQPSTQNFYWNHLNALQHLNLEKYRLLDMQSYSPRYTFFPWPYGSPAYQTAGNRLIIPHAYLRFPIFHPELHDLFLYAELGNTLGHEIMHSFDTNGLLHDAHGNVSPLLMESLGHSKRFISNLECLQQQRPSSLDEKIADFSGFRLAFDSYFQQPQVPQFEGHTHLSNKQLFFIKFAQFFCAIGSTSINYDDSHDSPFHRVSQVVENHPEFEEIFGCKRKKRALAKCNLW